MRIDGGRRRGLLNSEDSPQNASMTASPRPLVALDLSVLDAPHPSGVERQARELFRALPRALPEWDVVGLARRPLHEVGTARMVAQGNAWPTPLWRRRVLPKLCAKLGAIHLHTPVTSLPRRLPCSASRCVHDIPWAPRHSSQDERPHPLRERRLTRELQRPIPTVFVSEATAEDFASVVPDFSAPTVTIWNGVADVFFQDAPLVLPADLPPRFVLVVGKLRPRRRPDVLARAARRLEEDCGLAIVWVGEGTQTLGEGPLRGLGPVSDAVLRSLLSEAQALLSPSALEGFGIPVLEAMAAGRPVISAACDGVRRWAGDRVLEYPAGDSDALVGCVRRLMERPVDADALAARREFARSLSWSRVASQYAKFFRRLLAHDR